MPDPSNPKNFNNNSAQAVVLYVQNEDGSFSPMEGVTIGSVVLLAGTAKVGQVAIDQLTPGTTNAVQVVAIGSVSDAPWSGSGDGTVIALLKAIALNTTP